jgi:hypothetical protein
MVPRLAGRDYAATRVDARRVKPAYRCECCGACAWGTSRVASAVGALGAGDIVGSGSRSLRDTAASVTEADLWLMAQVAYVREMYGMDWLGEDRVVRTRCNEKQGGEKVVCRVTLKEIEGTGEWVKVLGE